MLNNAHKKESTLWCFILACLFILLAVLSFNIPFLFDDSIHILEADYLFSTPKDMNYSSLKSWYYRPLLSLSYLMNYKITGFNAGDMRLTNILIYLFCCGLIWNLFFKNISLGQSFQQHMTKKLIYAFLIFHPIMWHSVIYVSARSTLLSVFFILLSLWFYRLKSSWRWCFILTAVLAIACKETGMLAIPLILILDIPHLRTQWQQNKNSFLLLTTLTFCSALSFLALKQRYLLLFLDTLFGERNNPYYYPSYLLTQTKMFFVYIKNYFLPIQWDFTYDPLLLPADSFLSWICAICLITSIVFLARVKHKTYFVYLWAGVFCFLPEMFWPRNVLGQDQRCFLPFILLSVFLLNFIKDRADKRKLKTTNLIMLIMLGFNISLLVNRLIIYKNESRISSRSLYLNPYHNLATVQLAQSLLNQAKVEEAEQLLERVLDKRLPSNNKSHFIKVNTQKMLRMLFATKLASQQQGQAQALINICFAQKMHPDICYLLSAKKHRSQQEYQQALQALDQIQKKDSVTADIERALIYMQLQEKTKVLALYNKHADKVPANLSIVNLAIMIFKKYDDSKNLRKVVETTLKQLKRQNQNLAYQEKLTKILSGL